MSALCFSFHKPQPKERSDESAGGWRQCASRGDRVLTKLMANTVVCGPCFLHEKGHAMSSTGQGCATAKMTLISQTYIKKCTTPLSLYTAMHQWLHN